jgi:hypothetical protein
MIAMTEIEENMIYEDRDRLLRALRTNAEDVTRQLETDEAARGCAEALLAGDLDLARLHAGRYAALTCEPAIA